MSSLYFQICAFFVWLLITIIYFSKPRVKSLETKIYSILLIVSFFSLFFDIIIIFLTYTLDYVSILKILEILNKFYYSSILLWIIIFCIYVMNITFSIQKKSNNLFKTISNIMIVIYFISILFIFGLPVYIYNDNIIMYSYGESLNFLVFFIAFYLLIIIICVFLQKKEIKNKKFTPVYTLILLIILSIVVNQVSPGILLTTPIMVYITLIMYHTIENPDMKLINELNIAKSQAEQANNSKSEFLSSMSHEIRTPLNAILGFSQTLLEKDIKKEEKEDIKDIIVASENLLEIVNGILDISKIEANKLEIIKREYDFKELIRETSSLIKGKLKEKEIEYKEIIDSEIPQVLYGDSVRLKQIMVNLLTNAVKYTKEGLVEFKINSVIKNNICRLIISVEDTGIGIEKSKLPKLFTKFERMGVEGHTTIEGTGLGLAITKRLIELMGGTIVVQSEYGVGSKFTVAIDQRIVLNPSINIESTVSDSTNYDEKFKNKKILIVDDNKLNLKVASKMLESFKVKIELVNSGYECLDKIKLGNIYDLILLDDMMPHMTGVETLEKLKQIKGFNIPVVVFTANALTGMREKYLNDGFDDYLSKPVKKEDLFKVFKNIFKE